MGSQSKKKFCDPVVCLLILIPLFLGGTEISAQLENRSAEPRAFEMLVIGDSIMWGQGLKEDQKFYYKTKEWLEKEVFLGRRKVNGPLVLAHSGASIFPEFGLGVDFRRDYRSSETNVANPSVLIQAFEALEIYRSKKCLPDRGCHHNPEHVDLILLNGCINDFSVIRFVQPKLDSDVIAEFAKQFCGHGMTVVLKVLASAFPNARIIVTGYYSLISKETDADFLRNSLFGVFGVRPGTIFLNIPFFRENQKLRNELARRSDDWKKFSSYEIEKAVEQVNLEYPPNEADQYKNLDNVRIKFIPAPFCAKNSYGTDKKDGEKQSFVWSLSPNLSPTDPLSIGRAVGCRADGKKKIELEICKRASAFHPNSLGSDAYTKAIKKELTKILPYSGWLVENNFNTKVGSSSYEIIKEKP